MVLTKERVVYTTVGISRGYQENIRHQVTDLGPKEMYSIVNYLPLLLNTSSIV